MEALDPTARVARELDRAEAWYPRLARLLALPDERLTAARPEVSGWSAAKHLFHLLLANEMSLKNAAALVAGKGLLVRPFEGMRPEAEAIFRRGRIPRGAARSPRFVRPPERIDLAFTRSLAGSTLEQLRALAADPAALAAAPDCVPHQILGDLTASRWIRFVRMHTAHHALIARDVLGV